MAAETNEFWGLLADSKLLEKAVLQDLMNRFTAAQSAGSGQPASSRTLAKWLVKHKVLSPFQANILTQGLSGPLCFGNYLLVDRIEQGPLKNAYLARHRQTGHNVLLQFQAGISESDLVDWQARCQLAQRILDVRSPNLVPIFESIVLAEHRFVVSQIPYGKPLANLIPAKSRMRWQEACRIIGQAAMGLAVLHEHGVIHNAISPRTVWVSTSRPAQLQLQLFPDLEFESATDAESKTDYTAPELLCGSSTLADSRSDAYSLACTLYRVIAGRTPFGELPSEQRVEARLTARPRSLKKYEVPRELDLLVGRMLATDPADRFDSLDKFVQALGTFAGQRLYENTLSDALPATLPAFEQWLQRSKRVIVDPPKSAVRQIENTPVIDTGQKKQSSHFNPPSIAPAINESDSIASGKRGKKQMAWILPVAGLVTIASGVLIVLLLLNLDKDNQEIVANKPDLITDDATDSHDTESVAEPEIPIVMASPRFEQQLIDDDGQTLWETPTAGPPIDMAYVPPTAKIVFVFRVAEIVQNPEGQLLFRSLGPAFSQRLQTWTQRYGIQLTDIDRLIISLHSTPDFDYEPFYVIEFRKPPEQSRLLELWNNPTHEPDADYYTSDGGQAFCFLNTQNGQPENGTAKKILIGSRALMAQAIGSAGANSWSGPMKKMLPWTDADRHATILFQRNALFNDEGKKLMSGLLAGLHRKLSVMMDNGVRGGIFSLHLDEGTYLELRFDRSLDLKASDLRDSLQTKIRETRDRVFDFMQRVPANTYWDKIRLRYDNMMADLYRNTRINIEDREVIANCWLPPMAAHNIAAATELVLSFSDSTIDKSSETNTRKIPQTIEELLAAPRDLTVSTRPDLILLINSLQNEIRDDYGNLPFPFEIRMMGSDLGKDGITQNQRPNDFEVKQKPLSDILTEIMVQANPDRSISGPSDPKCKLIWVIADDPNEPGRRIILVTTRKAAEENSYDLPAAFKSE